MDAARKEAKEALSTGTAGLATRLTDLSSAQVPRQVVERTKDLVLDHLGVAIYSAALPWSKIVRAQAIEDGGPPDCTLYAGDAVGLRSAVLANATTAHGIELDDTHDESLSHPGAVVIPTVLGLVEKHQLTGSDAIVAIVAGYEAQGRIGACAGKPLYLGGFHPTSTTGVFGATAAAAKLLQLDAGQLESAWGIGLSMASGVMQFSEDPSGTMVKRLHAGIPAQSGILAAQLASRGFQGPKAAVEGRLGFLRVFAGHGDVERLLQDFGGSFVIEQISVKLYACCRLFHALIDAVNACRESERLSTAEIRLATAFGPRSMYAQHMQFEPDSVMAAQYSLPYTVAASLLFDPTDPDTFGEAYFRRADVLGLARLVQAEHSPELEALCPVKFPAGVRLLLRDGRVLERTVLDSVGTPMRPLDREGIVRKFEALTRFRLQPSEQAAVIESALGFDEEGGAQRLFRVLRGLRIEAASPSHARVDHGSA